MKHQAQKCLQTSGHFLHLDVCICFLGDESAWWRRLLPCAHPFISTREKLTLKSNAVSAGGQKLQRCDGHSQIRPNKKGSELNEISAERGQRAAVGAAGSMQKAADQT